MQRMKAAVFFKYGPPEVVSVQEVPRPVPKPDECLIKVKTACVSSGDGRLRSADPYLARLFFLFAARGVNILGSELAGIVESVGDQVTKFSVGDEVIASCLDAKPALGAHAEYKCIPQTGAIVKKPPEIDWESASAITFGGQAALFFLRQANIKPGQKVLIYGASGALGTAAIQLAKILFDAEVSAVCSSANFDLVKSLGADHVIDYTVDDFTSHTVIYDVIFDTIGKTNFSPTLSSLTPEGSYLRAVHMEVMPLIRGFWAGMTSKKKVIGGIAPEKAEDTSLLLNLTMERKFKPIIDSVYPLDSIVEAHRRVSSGHKRGSVVVSMS